MTESSQRIMRKAVFPAHIQQISMPDSELFGGQTAWKKIIFGPSKKVAAGTKVATDTVQGSPAQLICQHVQRQISHCQIKQCCQQQPHITFKPL